jgi:hypothetical protein
VPPRVDGDLQFGPHPVGGPHQNRVGKTRRARIEQSAEAAEAGGATRAGGGFGEGFDGLDQGFSGIDIDTGLPIG